MKFILNGKPISKKRPRFARVGRYVRTYDTQAGEVEAVKVRLKNEFVGGQYQGPLSVTLSFYLEVPKSWSKKKKAQACQGIILPTSKPDIDNYVKFYFDCMNGVVFQDDACIVHVECIAMYSAYPRTEIDVQEMILVNREKQKQNGRKRRDRNGDQRGVY